MGEGRKKPDRSGAIPKARPPRVSTTGANKGVNVNKESAISRRGFVSGAGLSLSLLGLAKGASAKEKRSRIDALIAKMTLEEKAGQVSIFPAAFASAPATAANPAAVAGTVEQQMQQVRDGQIGAVFNGFSLEWHRRMQRTAVEESRLGIPLLFAADVIHGFRTIFPVPLAEAASFDVDLAERTARAAAIEASSAGLSWNFAPMIDIARDQRWGRGTEGSGEDVLLACRFSAARVKGFQGGEGLAAPDSMLSTLKHFVAYGAAESGLDYAGADVSIRTLQDIYFPPFRAGLEAGSPAIMAAFNEVSGVPAHANSWLLQDVLRRQWGFTGLVVSDYTGDLELIDHGFAADGREAAKLALLAGVDMSMTSGLYRDHVPDLVRSGEVPEDHLDDAVRRVLLLKETLGLFDDPYNRLKGPAKSADAPAFRALAREAAQKSAVLLRNEGGLLPLPKSGKRIALIGPSVTAQTDQNGSWILFGTPDDTYPLSSAIADAMADARQLKVARGCDTDAAIDGGISEAVRIAEASDIVVMVLGESERMAGESKSRTTLTVPKAQRDLAAAVAAIGKPVVIILKAARAMVLDEVIGGADALMLGWFMGTEQSRAFADLLFGDAAPSGRLPVSFPLTDGQQPFYYARKATGRPVVAATPDAEYRARYLDTLHEAAYPFGHGLTYGDIVYGETEVGGDGALPWNGSVTITTTIENRGQHPARELVQLYIRDRVASVTQPIRRLVDFAHVDLAPGQKHAVTFTLTRKPLMFTGRDNVPAVEPGLFDLWVAPSAATGEKVELRLLPE